MTYHVSITRDALSQMHEIHQYIHDVLCASESADQQIKRIMDVIMSLSSMPFRFQLVSFEPERSEGLRRVVVDHYSVFYLVNQAEVTVISILYSASDLEYRMMNDG